MDVQPHRGQLRRGGNCIGHAHRQLARLRAKRSRHAGHVRNRKKQPTAMVRQDKRKPKGRRRGRQRQEGPAHALQGGGTQLLQEENNG